VRRLWQKDKSLYICFTDQADNSWDAVAKYVWNSLADNEDENKRMDSLDKSACVILHLIRNAQPTENTHSLLYILDLPIHS